MLADAVVPAGEALEWMTRAGWRRVPIVGKKWASGQQAYTYVNINQEAA